MGADPSDSARIASRSWRPSPDVVSQRLGDDIVLVHMGTNRIFELNRTAAGVWELLEQGESLKRIKAQLLADFDVEEGRLGQELDELLSRLVGDDLVIERDRD